MQCLQSGSGAIAVFTVWNHTIIESYKIYNYRFWNNCSVYSLERKQQWLQLQWSQSAGPVNDRGSFFRRRKLKLKYMHIYVCIYIYIYRERERCACKYAYIYIYIYIYTGELEEMVVDRLPRRWFNAKKPGSSQQRLRMCTSTLKYKTNKT